MDAELGYHNMPLGAKWASRTSVSAASGGIRNAGALG
jgi:hypothetical protein